MVNLQRRRKESEMKPGETQLIISISASGDINVSGPIADKLLCYGLLGIAKDLIKD